MKILTIEGKKWNKNGKRLPHHKCSTEVNKNINLKKQVSKNLKRHYSALKCKRSNKIRRLTIVY